MPWATTLAVFRRATVKPLLHVVEQFRDIILNSLENMEFESVE